MYMQTVHRIHNYVLRVSSSFKYQDRTFPDDRRMICEPITKHIGGEKAGLSLRPAANPSKEMDRFHCSEGSSSTFCGGRRHPCGANNPLVRAVSKTNLYREWTLRTDGTCAAYSKRAVYYLGNSAIEIHAKNLCYWGYRDSLLWDAMLHYTFRAASRSREHRIWIGSNEVVVLS